MTGIEFENHCAKILKKKGFKKIEVTKKSGDQGIDIIAYKHHKKYGIQCKLYEYPVGNKAVQEAYTGSRFYECDGGAIVMTNTTFTRAAKEAAEKTDVTLWSEVPLPKKQHILSKILMIFIYLLLLCVLFVLSSAEMVPEKIQRIFLWITISFATAGILYLAAKMLRKWKTDEG